VTSTLHYLERAKAFRAMAEEETAAPDLARTLRMLAEQWEALAQRKAQNDGRLAALNEE
jgi:hypothetical protein